MYTINIILILISIISIYSKLIILNRSHNYRPIVIPIYHPIVQPITPFPSGPSSEPLSNSIKPYSRLIILNWSHYHRPTVRPTVRPTTQFPSRPSPKPSLKPTMPTCEPTFYPTTPTMEPTTHLPTVYDFKVMNYSGYIATCTLVPYGVFGFLCMFIFVLHAQSLNS
jgi:hypothetical protein